MATRDHPERRRARTAAHRARRRRQCQAHVRWFSAESRTELEGHRADPQGKRRPL